MKKFMCKAILDKESASNTGPDWVVSKRCFLEAGDDYFKIGDRKFLFSEIDSSILKKVPSATFLPSCIFSINMKGGTSHHFGLHYSKFWNRKFPFPVERTSGEVPNLLVRRIIFVLAALYCIYMVIIKITS